MNTTWKFFSHFNRINMQRGNPKVWTVHFRGVCYQGEAIIFNVPTFTTYSPDRPQPRARIEGRARCVEMVGDKILVG